MSSLILGLEYGVGFLAFAAVVLFICDRRAEKREAALETAVYCALEADLRHFKAEEAA